MYLTDDQQNFWDTVFVHMVAQECSANEAADEADTALQRRMKAAENIAEESSAGCH